MIGPWARPRGIRVAPKTVSQIRNTAQCARLILGLNGSRINMIDLLENKLRLIGINFHIVESTVIPGEAARAIPDEGTILLTLEAYQAIHDGDVKQQLLVPHEFAHFVLKHAITFARAISHTPHPALEDSEVQADYFSHEFTMPVELVRRHCQSITAIQEVFGVPQQDAIIRTDMLRRENLISW